MLSYFNFNHNQQSSSDIIGSYWIGPVAVFLYFKWNPDLYRSNKNLLLGYERYKGYVFLYLYWEFLFLGYSEIRSTPGDLGGKFNVFVWIRQTKIVKFNAPTSGELMLLGVMVNQRKIISCTSLKTWRSSLTYNYFVWKDRHVASLPQSQSRLYTAVLILYYKWFNR